MSAMLKYLWHNQRLALIAFLLALSLTTVFAVRFGVSSLYWADPAHRDVQIEGWMTPRYVARSYGVLPEIVGAALAITPQTAPGRTLREIATAQGKSLDQLSADILAAVLANRTLHETLER